MNEDQERIDWQNVTVHRIPGELRDIEDLHFPINQGQVNDILGKILTQLEAMNLPEKSERANKAIFKQMIWAWFDEVIDNSYTSQNGCIAPIQIKHCDCDTEADSALVCSQCVVSKGVKLVDPRKVDPNLRIE